MEDDKALLLCRDRRHLVRIALDGRCLLADAHLSYIQSLRNTGIALGKFVESGLPAVEPSMNPPSRSPTPTTLSLTPRISNSPRSPSPFVEAAVEFFSSKVDVKHMKSGLNFTKTVKENAPIPVTATVHHMPPRSPNKDTISLDEVLLNSDHDHQPWDYFGFFHPIDNQLSNQDEGGFSDLNNVDEIRRLRKEEGIPELEEEEEEKEEKVEEISTIGFKCDILESEDDFDQSTSEPLVRIFKNINDDPDPSSMYQSHGTPEITPLKTMLNSSESKQQNIDSFMSPDAAQEEAPVQTTPKQRNGEKNVPSSRIFESNGVPEITPIIGSNQSMVALSVHGKEKEHYLIHKSAEKDFKSCMKAVQILFVRASDSGVEVPRMLEANKVQFRPLFINEKANKSKASTFLSTCFGWCTEETHLPEEPAHSDVKYLTWDRSVSSFSSSSRIPLVDPKDVFEDITNGLFSHTCMNSGSHASTLDRLYAWERKLHDEVKVSGVIRRDYDMKCKLLRQQESTDTNRYKIDKTRAAIKDLHSRIRVAIQRTDFISKKIEELRDRELLPQLEELIHGLSRMWETMLDCHKKQHSVISAARGGAKMWIHRDSHRQLVAVLESELESLCSAFPKWVSAQMSYLRSIYNWLVKCVSPLKHKPSRRRGRPIEFSPRRDRAPPIFVIVRDWLEMMKNLPVKNVTDAIKELVFVAAQFLPQQEKKKLGGGGSSFVFSFSRKAIGREEEDGYREEEDPAKLVVNFDGLQVGLIKFLDRLQSFAAVSVENYRELQGVIVWAKEDYKKEHSFLS